jgi:hypothetical protein
MMADMELYNKLATHLPKKKPDIIVVREIFPEYEPDIKTEQSSSHHSYSCNNVDVTDLIHLEGCFQHGNKT